MDSKGLCLKVHSDPFRWLPAEGFKLSLTPFLIYYQPGALTASGGQGARRTFQIVPDTISTSL